MEQQTDEWRLWRHKGIGASDTPVIMGVSPYKKAYKLFEEKIQPEPSVQVDNFILEKGNRKEPIARAKMEIILGITLTPKLVEHHQIPIIRMSSDGMNTEHKVAIEVKYVGANFFTECPDKYFPQLQHQHFCLGEGWVIYFVQINDKDEISYCMVDVDQDYIQKKMLPRLSEFWKMVTSKTWDIDAELRNSLFLYEEMKIKLDEITEAMDDLKKTIFEKTGDKFNYDRFTVNTVSKSGSVDYKKIVEEKLPSLDLAPYKKKGTSYKEIRIKPPVKANEAV